MIATTGNKLLRAGKVRTTCSFILARLILRCSLIDSSGKIDDRLGLTWHSPPRHCRKDALFNGDAGGLPASRAQSRGDEHRGALCCELAPSIYITLRSRMSACACCSPPWTSSITTMTCTSSRTAYRAPLVSVCCSSLQGAHFPTYRQHA